MALVVHHVRKDVRLLAPILLAWTALTVALHAVVLVGAATYVPGIGQGNTLRVLFNVLLGLNIAGFIAVPVVLFQADPAPGTTAFWLTRPVPVPVLLAAKCLTLVALLVIVPVVLDVLTLVAGGVPLQSAFSFVADSLFVELAWLLPVVAVAAITTSLAQFVVVAAAEVAACSLILTTITWLGVRVVPELPVGGLVGIASILSLAVLVISYGWRHTGGGIAIACMAPIILCFTLTRWPSANTLRAEPPAPRPVPRSVAVTLSPGTRFHVGRNATELLSAGTTPEGYEVTFRQVGPHSATRSYAAYSLRNPRGETLASGWRDRLDEPFFVTVVPVPQHLTVVATKITFPWTERPDTDLERWVKGAVMVVTER